MRKPGKLWSKFSCANRTELSGGRYFSLMPPRDSCPSGITSRTIKIRIGAAKAIGRFITTLTSRPQKPFSTSSRVLVFCNRSASQFSHQFIGFQLRKNGTRSNVRTPSASTLRPRMPRVAANTVIDRIDASMTEAMIA